jgi:dUTP pyrophosphatase
MPGGLLNEGITMIQVRVRKLHELAKMPRYAHSGEYGDLAADLYSVEDVTLETGDVRTIATGIAIEFPAEYGGIIADRSGLAMRGLTTFAGVVDPGYRGEIRVVASYFGKEPLVIKAGDRIAQMRIVRRIEAEFIEAAEIQDTDRSGRGFGSSGR